ncbi:hypothetical protein [Thalassotalea maritima]|uniref:hypothetical protein n=1 Tax=Thalassotalea maritima TaxID=3242416 RepID=UPI003527B8E5
MKNLLIIIVAIAVYLHYYPNQELNAWYDKQLNTAQTMFNEVAGTKLRISPKKVITVLSKELQNYSNSELAYVEQITDSRDNLRAFYSDYCPELKPNRKLRRAYVRQVCKAVDDYRILRN